MNARENLMHDWLAGHLTDAGFRLEPASEDASFRRYFRVVRPGGSLIVMDAPPGKEDCHAFVDITSRLRDCGVNAPRVHAVDYKQGFVMLDDFGVELYLDVLNAGNADRLYGDATAALQRLQSGARTDGLPLYDEKLLRQEMALFQDWLLERHLRLSLSSAETTMLEQATSRLAAAALEQPRVFVHRDFHSRNLMYTPAANPGVIDYQDAVLGPVSYDPVSLFRDCYIKWPADRVRDWALAFRQQSRTLADVDAGQWLRWFDLMGAQRHLKASGIFARLCHRDGKAGFLPDIPRTLSYIVDLQEQRSELAPLAVFIGERVLPALESRA